MALDDKITDIPKLIAHRGASAYAPENTLTAFIKAAAMGASWLEFDVKLAACGTPIIFHDDELQRVSNGRGHVYDYSYEELKQFTILAKHGSEASYIPTLKQTIACLQQHNLGANIEIKPNPNEDVKTAQAVIALLQQYWPNELSAPLISSFSHSSLETAYHQAPELNYGVLMHEWSDQLFDFACEINACSIHLNHRIVNQSRANKIKEKGFKLLSYTVNERSRAEKLFSLGVDSIFSDEPQLLD